MYAGDMDCLTVWKNLSSPEKCALVDVRTTKEWETIGHPDLSSINKSTLFVEWQTFPSMAVNPDFATQVDEALRAQGIEKSDPVFCLCRSGVRSKSAAAALTQMGYTNAFNIVSGFEGDPDETGQRANLSGWQYDQLPWKKSNSSTQKIE